MRRITRTMATMGCFLAAQVCVAAIPEAPLGLMATADSQTEITLAWADNSGDESGFKIERSPDGIGSWSQVDAVGANVETWTDDGLNANELWYYRVRAWNGDGDSGYSNTANAHTAYAKQDGGVAVWKCLLLVYEDTDADYIESGQSSHYTGSLSPGEIEDAVWAFYQYISLCNELSDRECVVLGDVVFPDGAVTQVSDLGSENYWVEPDDIAGDIDTYAPPGSYDSILVHWQPGDIPRTYLGMAYTGPVASANGATYGTVLPWSGWYSEGKDGEAWLHEWGHGMCGHMRNLGHRMPQHDMDGKGYHGYTGPNWEYYYDLFRDRVWETNPPPSEYTGVPAAGWRAGGPATHRLNVQADWFYLDSLSRYTRQGTVQWDGGTHDVELGTAAAADNRMYTPLLRSGSLTLRASLYLPSSGVGSWDSVSLALRGGSDEWWATIEYGADLTQQLSLFKNDVRQATYPVTLAGGWYAVKLSVDDDSDTISMKAWPRESNEPASWQLSAALPAAWAADEIGFRHYGQGTRVDDLVVTRPRDTTPTVSTDPPANVTTTTADLGGNATDDNGADIAARGLVWNTSPGPTTSSHLGMSDHGGGTGGFSETVTGLAPGSWYYVRAYAVNAMGTSYGDEYAFSTQMDAPGNVLDFDGSDDYVDCGSGLVLSNRSFTVEFWARRDTSGGWDVVAGQGTATDHHELHIGFRSNDTFTFAFYNDDLDSPAAYTDSDWHHWACVYDAASGMRRLYRDGSQVASDTPSVHFQGSGTFYLGRRGSADEGHLDGRLEAFRVWDSARTEAQIRDQMHLALDGDESGLLLHYTFDQSNGSILPDRTSNGHDGTLTSMNDDDWVASAVPWADVVASRTQIRGAWAGRTASLSSGRLALTNAVTPGAAFAVFGHDNASETQNTADRPDAVDWRLNRVWQLEESGNVTADVAFDLAGWTGDFVLLVDADGTFADASVRTGSRQNDRFAAPGLELDDGAFYTLGHVVLPSVTTAPVSGIASDGATCGGTVTDAGSASVTTRGCVWNTAGGATVDAHDGMTVDGSGEGFFVSTLDNLPPGMSVYVRAYATSAAGTAYGEERQFVTPMTPSGNALSLDGTNDAAEVPHDDALKPTNALSVCVWVYKSDWNVSKTETVVGCHENGGYALRIANEGYGDGDNIQAIVHVNDKDLTAWWLSDGLAPGWHHLALTYNGQYVFLYVDGKYRAARHDYNPYPIQYDPDNSLIVGAEAGDGTGSTGQHMGGRIDDLSIWNVAYGESEIRDLMHHELGGDETGLLAYYDMNRGDGTNLPDRTAGGNDGALRNGAGWTNSFFPCADLIADATHLRGAWPAMTTSWPSGRLTLEADAVTGTNYAVFGHNGVAETTNLVDIPPTVAWRLDRAWRVEDRGALAADLTFDTTGLGGPFVLLVDADGAFTNATRVSGTTSENAFEAPGVPLETGSYYTIAQVNLAAVSTGAISNRTHATAMGGGTVTDDGGTPVTARGLVWSAADTPTVDAHDGMAVAGNGTGAFDATLSGLAPDTTYTVRAFAENGHGVAYGNAVVFTTRMTPPGRCLDFDGNDDKAIASGQIAPRPTDALTVEAWVRLDDADRDCKIVSAGQSTSWAYCMGVRSGRLYPEVWDADATRYAFEAGAVPADGWTHLAMVYTRNGALVGYVNGVEVGRTDVADRSVRDTSDELKLAVDPGGSDHYVDGRIEEVRVWHVTRTADELLDNMHRELTGREDGLSAYYDFNHASGTALDDRTSDGSSQAGLHNMDDTDWVVSTLPCAASIAGRLNLRGAWSERPRSLASSLLVISNGPVAEPDFAVLGHDGGPLDANADDKPGALAWRLNRTWRIENSGLSATDLHFDCASLDALAGAPELVRLVVDDDGTFVDGAVVAGTYADDIFTVTGQVLSAAAWYTLGRIETGSRTWYVDASRPDDSGDGGAWVTAKRTLQAAVDLAWDGDIVRVTNGVYDAGSALTPGETLTNRVAIDKAVILESVNGPDVTSIVGAPDPSGGNGNGAAAVRCVFIDRGGTIRGFTLTNGYTDVVGSDHRCAGGGLFLYDGIASNCVIRGNHGYRGAGLCLSYGTGTVVDCTVAHNTAESWGGGIMITGDDGLVDRCRVTDNTSAYGGGLYHYQGGTVRNTLIARNAATDKGGGINFDSAGRAENATVVSNSAATYGGGIRFTGDSSSVNCIVVGNSAGTDGDNCFLDGGGTVTYSCTTPDPGGEGNIAGDPMFADADYRLGSGSPCIDAAANGSAPDVDLDGVPRPLDGDADDAATADMGCYEFLHATADTDGDGIADGDEWIVDSSLISSNAPFRIIAVSNRTVFFQSSENRLYSLLSCTNLIDGVWATNETRMGIGGSDSLQSTNSLPQEFYRVKVSLP